MSMIDPESLMFSLVDAAKKGGLGQVLFPYNSCIRLTPTTEFWVQRAKILRMAKALAASFRKIVEKQTLQIVTPRPEGGPID